MLSLPWSCVTQLKLEPVGPIDPQVFGLRYVDTEHGEGWAESTYAIVDLPRARQTRDLWSTLQYDPRVIQQPYKPEKHPTWTAFCELQRGLHE